ncbi:MAG: hypothetical protein ABI184_03490, partial [Ginsengibacter sp.]
MKVIKGNFSDQNKKQKNSLEKKNEDIPIISDEDGNYSVMLIDLIKCYMDANPTADDLEEKLQLGILAWNLAIQKPLGIEGYNDSLKSAVAEAGLNKKQVELIKKMEKDKQTKYPEHNSFIKDYELKEDTDNRMKVMVNCLPLMDMMSEGLDLDDDDFDDDDLLENDQYEEGIVDRSAFSLNYKSAFKEWAKKANINIKPTVNVIYLVDEKDSEQEANDWLKKNFQKIMSDELAAVTDNKRKWPK